MITRYTMPPRVLVSSLRILTRLAVLGLALVASPVQAALPLVGIVSPPVELTEGVTGSVIWADDNTFDQLNSVYAEIVTPSGGSPIVVTMHEDQVDGRFEFRYQSFFELGVYNITIFVRDNDSNVSPGVSTTVTQTVVIDLDGPDAFEDDDTPEDANLIVVSDIFPQRHNFHDPGDADYVRFLVEDSQNLFFDIEVKPVFDNSHDVGGNPRLNPDGADVVLQVLEGDGTTLIQEIDDLAGGEAENYTFTPSTPGVYYLRISNFDNTVGSGAAYTVKIFEPIAPAAGPDVTLQQTFFDTTLPLGAGVALELVITNLGTASDEQVATNVKLYTALDTLTINGPLPDDCSPATKAVICIIGDMEKDASVMYTLPLKISSGGRPYLMSSARSFDEFQNLQPDETPGNNQRQTRFQIGADTDSDGDGIPDSYEAEHIADGDPNGDPDGDGDDNLTEYQNGTNPNVAPAGTDVAPVLTILGDASVTLVQGNAYIDAGATATDAEDGPLAVTTTNPVDTNVADTYTVTYSVTDSFGHTVTATRSVTVTADQLPVITITGGDVSILQGQAYVDAGATALDAEDGVLTVTTTNPVNTNVADTYTVTYSVTDSFGHTVTATRTVTVTADQLPVITVNGGDVSITQGETYTDAGATAQDPEDGTLTVTTTNPVDTNVADTYTVTYSVTDSFGHTVTATRTVTVTTDTSQPPVLSVTGGDVTITRNMAYVDAGATAQDAEDGDLTGDIVVSSTVNTASVGEYTVTYIVTDSDDNTVQATRQVSVLEDQAPTITLNGSSTITLMIGDSWTDPGASASDAEDGDLTNEIMVGGSVDPDVADIYTLTYTVMDSFNHVAQVSRTVNMIADESPVITLRGSDAVTIVLGDTYNDMGATATDVEDGNLTSAIVVNSNVNVSEVGSYLVSYSVTDSANNTSTASRQVSVVSTVSESRLINLSTRGDVLTGDNILIGGFVISGTEDKTVLVRARGPSLADANVPGSLDNPFLRLFDSAGLVVASNDNWSDDSSAGLIPSDLRPVYTNEATLLRTLAPGAYTAQLSGVGGTTGVGIVEVFETSDTGTTQLVNLSTRGHVGLGDDVMIGGLIIDGSADLTVTIRARGPSIEDADPNLAGQLLVDPVLELWEGAGEDAILIDSNDNWADHSSANRISTAQRPTNNNEAALQRTLMPNVGYTVIVRGVDNGQGIGIVEVLLAD